MALPTDYHAAIRDAVAETLRGLALGCEVKTIDALEDADELTTPVIVVACVGPLQDRPEMGTNERKGRGYPVVVGLLSLGTTKGEKSPNITTATLFREVLDDTFDHKRLTGVDEVGWCEVSDSGPLWDEKGKAFQKLQAAMVVNAVGRFPRS